MQLLLISLLATVALAQYGPPPGETRINGRYFPTNGELAEAPLAAQQAMLQTTEGPRFAASQDSETGIEAVDRKGASSSSFRGSSSPYLGLQNDHHRHAEDDVEQPERAAGAPATAPLSAHISRVHTQPEDEVEEVLEELKDKEKPTPAWLRRFHKWKRELEETPVSGEAEFLAEREKELKKVKAPEIVSAYGLPPAPEKPEFSAQKDHSGYSSSSAEAKISDEAVAKNKEEEIVLEHLVDELKEKEKVEKAEEVGEGEKKVQKMKLVDGDSQRGGQAGSSFSNDQECQKVQEMGPYGVVERE
ncbi:unnamed protein product, partial [Mesorhabditis spiculigera]